MKQCPRCGARFFDEPSCGKVIHESLPKRVKPAQEDIPRPMSTHELLEAEARRLMPDASGNAE